MAATQLPRCCVEQRSSLQHSRSEAECRLKSIVCLAQRRLRELPQHVPVNREAQGAAVAHRHKGVILVLRGRNIGLELNVSVSGVEISLR